MNDKYDASEMNGFDDISLNTLEEGLEQQLSAELDDLTFLEEEKEKIGDPDALGETVLNVIWEQFINQVAVTAGEDFIQKNRGLTLDLRKEAHIQTTENFAQGKIAGHNTVIDYQQRYDDWQNNFQRNEDGSIRTKVDYRTGEKRAVLRERNKKKDPTGENYNLNYDARAFIDKGRPTGSKTVNKDHTISAAEIIRDPEAAAHLSREEQASFANSEVNLVDLDSAANQSKSDSSMSEWLDSERTGKGAGQSQAEYFGVDEQDLRDRDKKAREEYEKRKQEGEKRSIEAGKKSQKQEFYRISGTALRTAVMTLLAALIKEIIGKLVLWLKSAKKNFDTFIEYVKFAVKTFIGKLKGLLVNVADSVLTTIVTSILGPVVGTIKKVFMLLKQGWVSLKNAIAFLRAPENRGKSLSYLLPQVGIIVITGLTGVGAIVLGEVIEKALSGIPFMAVDIPLLGSLANLIGMFMGAIVCGIIGAIAINMINAFVTNKQKNDNLDAQIDKKNEILQTQDKLLTVKSEALCETQRTAQQEIAERHKGAGTQLRGILSSIVDPTISAAQDINNEQLDDLLQSF